MSTIINALTNRAPLDDVHNQHNVSGQYNVISHGFYNYNRHSFLHEDGGVSSTLSTFVTPNTPSLQNMAAEDDASIDRLKFIMLGVIGSFMIVLGFLGNTMSMVVLQTRQMRSSTSYYLLSLAIYDNCILLSMLVYFVIPSLATNTPFMEIYRVGHSLSEPIGYPLSLAAQMGSVYTCVGFTVERFIAVCRPLQVANTCTKSRTIRAIILIFVWAVVYNIPRFFEFETVIYDSGDEGGPLTSMTSSSGNHANATSLLYHNASYPIQSPLNLGNFGAPCNEDSIHTHPSPCQPFNNINMTSMDNIAQNPPHIPQISDSYEYNENDVNNDDYAPSLSWSAYSLTPSTFSSSTFSSLPSSSSSSSSSSYHSSLEIIVNKKFSTVSPIPPPMSPAVPSSLSNHAAVTTTPTSSTTPTSDAQPRTKIVKVETTSFGANKIFKNLYRIYSYLIFMFLLPFLIILFMNIGLIRAVKRSKSMQQRTVTPNATRKERNLTVMLIAVIVVFLVCQFPSIIDNILIAVFGRDVLYPNFQYQCFYATCTLMVLLNSASNFLLYCFFGKKFRTVLLSLLGIKKRPKYVAYRSTMYRSRSNGSRVCDIEVSVV